MAGVSGNHTVSAVFLLLEFGAGRTVDQLTKKLTANGVPKGTVCKMRTVMAALQEGAISTSDVRSLNYAYELVKKPKSEFREILAKLVNSSDEEIQQLATFVTVEARKRGL